MAARIGSGIALGRKLRELAVHGHRKVLEGLLHRGRPLVEQAAQRMQGGNAARGRATLGRRQARCDERILRAVLHQRALGRTDENRGGPALAGSNEGTRRPVALAGLADDHHHVQRPHVARERFGHHNRDPQRLGEANAQVGGLAGNRVGGNNDKRAGIEPAERLAPALHFSGH